MEFEQSTRLISTAVVKSVKGSRVANKGQKKNKNRERRERGDRSQDDNISRLTRTFRNKEHMAHEGQSHAGDEELARHLREPFKSIVIGGRDVQ